MIANSSNNIFLYLSILKWFDFFGKKNPNLIAVPTVLKISLVSESDENNKLD